MSAGCNSAHTMPDSTYSSGNDIIVAIELDRNREHQYLIR
jgi:hypothetical protein